MNTDNMSMGSIKAIIIGLKLVRAMTIGVLIGVAFAALALWLTPLVHADEGTYINDLALLDIPINPATLPLGHQICADISTHGVSGVDRQVRTAIASGISTHDGAGIIVLAVQELCPSNTPALNAWEAQH